MSDHQMNQNPIYHPLLRDMKVKLGARCKPEREGTSKNMDTDTVPSSAKKPRPDMNPTWSSTIKENQNKK
jgi:hypothetical protein